MKKYTFLKMLLFATMLCSNALFADGSKDLYPSGAIGVRAYLRSSTSPTVNWPFPNQGFHYVYAKVGERITMASSAQSTGGNAKIRLYSPAGSLLIDNATGGVISNRAGELAGPQLSGGSISGKYTPIYYQVPANGAGIYRVEFFARQTGDPQTTFNADSNWTQSTNDAGIMAWDVSVINPSNTAFIPGRVYANVFNLSNGTGQVSSNGFYGKIYTLTKDGYTYRVNNNGNNGIYFTFFVNNNGFLDSTTQLPIYKSLPSSSSSDLAGKVQNPNSADTTNNITHKMFYTLPSTDLPTSSTGAVPGGSTWLKNAVVTPQVSNVTLTGVEGTPGQVSNKGGYIKFNADVQGNYTITINATPANPTFVPRVLTGASTAGANQIYWDSKDGNNNASPVGTFPVTITIKLQGAEVHFPYMDMEYNRFGTIVELLNHTNLTGPAVSDIVYWNDTDIPNTSDGSNPNPKNNSHLPPANSAGISSNTNGHIWGVGGSGTSGQFGDQRAIDTWTFIKGQETTVSANVTVKSADLMISSLTHSQTNVVVGDPISYTVKVKNGGPSDVTGAPFTFKIPNGFTPQNIQFVGNGCGSEGVPLNYNAGTNTYSSTLNLPSGCEITYTITLVVGSTAAAGHQVVVAAILRTNDVTDPDATDPNLATLPTNAQSECTNNGLGGSCNNIKTDDFVVVTLACYNPSSKMQGPPAIQGITLLQRAGAGNGGWPMNRTSAFTVLESNTKGLVITRMTSDPTRASAVNHLSKITNPVEGMMVYDAFCTCLKIYADGAWKSFTKPACP